jgi:hypothetical protein
MAAFIAEPVQGAGGVIVPPPGYFPRVQAVLKRSTTSSSSPTRSSPASAAWASELRHARTSACSPT